MFCSDSPDMILSNICSIINPAEKYRNTVVIIDRGWQKLKKIIHFSINHIADSSTH